LKAEILTGFVDSRTAVQETLERLDWLGTHYQGGLRESADIMLDSNDEQGF
jgi:hypothetical protein